MRLECRFLAALAARTHHCVCRAVESGCRPPHKALLCRPISQRCGSQSFATTHPSRSRTNTFHRCATLRSLSRWFASRSRAAVLAQLAERVALTRTRLRRRPRAIRSVSDQFARSSRACPTSACSRRLNCARSTSTNETITPITRHLRAIALDQRTGKVCLRVLLSTT